jgi:hypothetical protein
LPAKTPGDRGLGRQLGLKDEEERSGQAAARIERDTATGRPRVAAGRAVVYIARTVPMIDE